MLGLNSDQALKLHEASGRIPTIPAAGLRVYPNCLWGVAFESCRGQLRVDRVYWIYWIYWSDRNAMPGSSGASASNKGRLEPIGQKWGGAEPQQTLGLPALSHPEAGRGGLPPKLKNEGNTRRTVEA